jgi:molecular chaperone GrpE
VTTEEENTQPAETAPAEPTAAETPGPAPDAAGGDAAAKLRELEVHYAAKDEAFQDMENQYRRLAADFENFRRRQQQERETLIKSAGERILERFLEILDNFERALQVGEKATDPQQVLTGVSLIYRQLQDFLGKEGVTAMEAKGQPFDPLMHEAVLQEAAEDVPDHTVLDEFRKGYLLNGRVLRHAMVKIADNPAMPAVPPAPPSAAEGEASGEPANSHTAQ